MSAITIDDDLVHFEALGRGRPVILLHGWLGSWRYWVPAMRQLSGKYRTYALDLWGFGDSARDANRYTFDAQVALLEEFIDRMGIKKAALIGHDLGAAVVARYAAKHPDRVPRLMVVSPPLFWMSHQNLSLTQNTTSTIASMADAKAAEAKTDASSDAKPAAPATPTAAGAVIPAKPEATPSGDGQPVVPKAETVPWRTEQMKARIRASLERQAHKPATAESINPVSKPPSTDAKPATETPAKAADASKPPAPAVPKPLDEVPTMPKMDYVPGDSTLQMKMTNLLKEHLKTTDRFALLEKHVDDNPDRKKLRDEIEKSDPMAVSMTMDSFGFVDTLTDLRNLAMPLMVIQGQNDTFMQIPDARMIDALESGRTTCAVRLLQHMKHFPMLEEKAGFTRLLMEFLEASDVRQVELTEVWERRVR